MESPYNKFKSCEDDETPEHKMARKNAFMAVIASVSVTVLAITLIPLLFVSLHGLSSEVQSEADFCKIRIRDIWYEMYNMQKAGGPVQQRQKRGWLFGQWVPENNNNYGAPGNEPNYNPPAPSSGYGPVVNAEPAPLCSCKISIKNHYTQFPFRPARSPWSSWRTRRRWSCRKGWTSRKRWQRRKGRRSQGRTSCQRALRHLPCRTSRSCWTPRTQRSSWTQGIQRTQRTQRKERRPRNGRTCRTKRKARILWCSRRTRTSWCSSSTRWTQRPPWSPWTPRRQGCSRLPRKARWNQAWTSCKLQCSEGHNK